MPRRAPPTSLRLVPGPTPHRGYPKHTLPSVPQPTFQPPSVQRGPTPRPREYAADTCNAPQVPHVFMSQTHSRASSVGSGSESSSPVGVGKIMRGPWDHSGSIPVHFDVETILAPLKPVATTADGELKRIS